LLFPIRRHGIAQPVEKLEICIEISHDGLEKWVIEEKAAKPLSKGGPHIKSNVQCECHECNGKKSDAWPPPLIGQASIFPLLIE
jgi:hypothetical protein